MLIARAARSYLSSICVLNCCAIEDAPMNKLIAVFLVLLCFGSIAAAEMYKLEDVRRLDSNVGLPTNLDSQGLVF
jgi:hypothetical protein